MPLCKRASNRFELTPEGMLVAQTCAEMLQHVRDLPNRLANLPTEVIGHFRIVSVTSITSPRLDQAVAEFHRQCPKVQIEIDIVSWEDVTRRLKKQTADIGIAPARFFDATFQYRLLDSESVRIYCGRTHPLYGKTLSTPDELADQGTVLTGGDEPDVIRRYRVEHGLGRVVAGQSEYLDEAKRLTIQGVGLCFLPEPFAAKEVEAGELWPLLPDSESFTSDIYFISLPPEQIQLPARMFETVLDTIWESPD